MPLILVLLQTETPRGLKAENCFKECPGLVVDICLVGLRETKGSPLLPPPQWTPYALLVPG